MTWQGGVFQGKRYAIPLDVPQHAMYFNLKIMKDAGLVGPDGRPKVPASGAELLAMAKQITKDDTFGFVIGSGLNIPGYTFGFHHMLWQNGANVYAADLKRSALAEPAAIEAAEFWGGFLTQHKVAPPAASNPRDVFVAGKLGMWLAGSWNVAALRGAKIDFAVAPMPRFLKQPVVWTIPHQYVLPEAQGGRRGEARRRLDAHPLDDRSRGRVDAEGRAGLGGAQGPLGSPHHGRSGPAHAPGPGAQLAGRASPLRSGSRRRT